MKLVEISLWGLTAIHQNAWGGWRYVDIYRATRRWDKYSPLASDAEGNSSFILFYLYINIAQKYNL